MTIREYIDSIDLFPFIESKYIDNSQEENVIRHDVFQDLLSDYLYFNMGNLHINDKYSSNEIQKRITLMYKNNEYRYITLYETTTQEYNPIENYSMTEKTITTYEGQEEKTLTKEGKEKNINSYNGSEVNSHNIGEHNTSNVEQSSPFDSTDFINTSKNDEHTSAYNDSITKTFNNRSDSLETEFTNRKDTEINSFENRVDTITHTRSGNIGVMTPKDMLESQRILANFNFLSVVAHDIVKTICIGIY